MNLSPTFRLWVYKSIIKHFDSQRNGLHMFVEGFKRDTDDKDKWFELRIDGPDLVRTVEGQGRILVTINTFTVCVRTDNAYDPFLTGSKVHSMFTNNICVKNDSEDVIGQLVSEKKINFDHFGSPDQQNSIIRFMSEVDYHMDVDRQLLET